MAEVKVEVKVTTKTAENSIAGVSRQLKELRAQQASVTEGGKLWKALGQQINDTEGKLGDLNDRFKTLSGSGVERLNSSMGLLAEGFTSFDTGKIKLGLEGIKGAMSAIPIFLLIEGVKLLVENFDIVIEFAKSFTTAAREQKAALSELNTAYNDLAGNLDEIAFKQKELTRNIDTANKLAIENAKQRGASVKEINALEVKGNEDKLGILKKAEDNYRKQKEFADSQYTKALKTEDEEAIKKAKESLDKTTSAYKSSIDARKDAEAGLTIFQEQKQTESYEKFKEIAKKKENDALELAKKLQAEEADRMNAAIDKEEADAKKLKETRERAIDELQQLQIKQNQEKAQQYLDEEKKAKEQSDKLIAIKKQEQDAKAQIEKNYMQAATDVAALFFQFQLNAAEGNEAKQLEIKKKAFQVEKTFRAAQATIDTIAAVQKTFAAGGVLATPLAISMGVLGAANVAKILSAKFNGGAVSASGLSGGGADKLTSGAPLGGQLPQNQTRGQDSTTYDERGNKTGGTMWVSVSEINKVQNNVARVAEQARF